MDLQEFREPASIGERSPNAANISFVPDSITGGGFRVASAQSWILVGIPERKIVCEIFVYMYVHLVGCLIVVFWVASGIAICHRALRIARLPVLCEDLRKSSLFKQTWSPFLRFNDSYGPVPSSALIILRGMLLGPYRFWASVMCVFFAAIASMIFPVAWVAATAKWSSAKILSSLGVTVLQRGQRASRLEAPCLVPNHIGPLDMLGLLSVDCCFVANEKVLDTVFIGRVTASIRSIFVGRDSADSRKAAKKTITERLCDDSRDWPQLVIFPEGTTTSGRGLVQFRRGAFESGRPVQPVSIRYSNLQLSMAMVDVIDYFCFVSTLPGSTMTLEYLPVVSPTQHDTPEDVAAKCRSAIAASQDPKLALFGLESHRDERELMNFISHLNRKGSAQPRQVKKSN